MPTVNLFPVVDTYVDSAAPTTSFEGAGNGLQAKADIFSFVNSTGNIWMRFDLSSVPPSATITSARVVFNAFYTESNYNDISTIIQRSTSTGWTGSITYLTQPGGLTGSTVAIGIAAISGTVVEYAFTGATITAGVQSALGAAAIAYRITVGADTLNRIVLGIHSIEYNGTHPYLEVIYTNGGIVQIGNMF